MTYDFESYHALILFPYRFGYADHLMIFGSFGVVYLNFLDRFPAIFKLFNFDIAAICPEFCECVFVQFNVSEAQYMVVADLDWSCARLLKEQYQDGTWSGILNRLVYPGNSECNNNHQSDTAYFIINSLFHSIWFQRTSFIKQINQKTERYQKADTFQ